MVILYVHITMFSTYDVIRSMMIIPKSGFVMIMIPLVRLVSLLAVYKDIMLRV